MSKVSITRSKLDSLAVTIATKSGVPAPMTIAEMEAAVSGITTGVDTSQDTVDAAHLLDGYTAHDHTGAAIVGEYVPSATPTLQSKSVSITPSESAQSQTVQPDSGYDGLDEVSVSVGAVSSTYVGSGITRRSSSDLSASGATITAPAGYYAENASTSVSSGSASTPGTTITATPAISVSSAGLITASVSTSENVTPTVSEGYVSSGTAGTITVSGSDTSQLSTQAAKTVTPTESEQTAVASGKYTTGIVKVGAISSSYVGSGVTRNDSSDLTASGATITAPAGYYAESATKTVASGTAGTPSATKGTVSNHSVSVTPKVTNTTGYISGGTKTGTAVTVTASELVSGSQTITSNSTVDVTNLETVVVNVSGAGASQTIYCGTSAPSASVGADGDVYITTNSGGTLAVYPASFEASSMNSTSNASRCIGVSAEDGSATGNMYSSGSGVTGVVEYSFDLSGIPSTATIDSVSCVVMAHEENASRSAFTLQLYAGSTAKGSETTVDGTSNTLYTLTTGTWTRAELDTLVLHTEYGYYGGLVAGATLTIVYSVDNATYDVILTGTSTNWSISGNGIYQKTSGSWTSVSSVTLDSTIGRN